jgi:hypothetical protein
MNISEHVSADQFYFRLCSDHLSVEALPRRRLKVNINRMKGHPIREHELIFWTPVLVVLRARGGSEITLRRDGRMIIRKATSEDAARECAARVLEVILHDFSR